MDGISGVSTNATGAVGSGVGSGAGAAGAAGEGASALADGDMFISSGSSSSTSMVSRSSVTGDTALDQATEGDAMLKMMIALLLLDLLLGQEQEQQQGQGAATLGAMLLGALLGEGSGGSGSTMMYSETTTMQIDYTSGSYGTPQAGQGAQVDTSA